MSVLLPVTDFARNRGIGSNSNGSHSSKSTSKPSESSGILKPCINDILNGRGYNINRHAGNIYFRKLVDKQKKFYASSTFKRERKIVVATIVARVKELDPPGRFLSLDSKTGLWHEISQALTYKKTSQALRENIKSTRDNEAAAESGGINNVSKQKQQAKQARKEYRQRIQPHLYPPYPSYGHTYPPHLSHLSTHSTDSAPYYNSVPYTYPPNYYNYPQPPPPHYDYPPHVKHHPTVLPYSYPPHLVPPRNIPHSTAPYGPPPPAIPLAQPRQTPQPATSSASFSRIRDGAGCHHHHHHHQPRVEYNAPNTTPAASSSMHSTSLYSGVAASTNDIRSKQRKMAHGEHHPISDCSSEEQSYSYNTEEQGFRYNAKEQGHSYDKMDEPFRSSGSNQIISAVDVGVSKRSKHRRRQRTDCDRYDDRDGNSTSKSRSSTESGGNSSAVSLSESYNSTSAQTCYKNRIDRQDDTTTLRHLRRSHSQDEADFNPPDGIQIESAEFMSVVEKLIMESPSSDFDASLFQPPRPLDLSPFVSPRAQNQKSLSLSPFPESPGEIFIEQRHHGVTATSIHAGAKFGIDYSPVPLPLKFPIPIPRRPIDIASFTNKYPQNHSPITTSFDRPVSSPKQNQHDFLGSLFLGGNGGGDGGVSLRPRIQMRENLPDYIIPPEQSECMNNTSVEDPRFDVPHNRPAAYST